MRDEEKLSKIRDIPIDLIDDFPDHPYRVQDDEDMERLVESIKERGVITPAMVRQKKVADTNLFQDTGEKSKSNCRLSNPEMRSS